MNKAIEEGQRIYSITGANINTALTAINHSIEVEDDIRNAVNAGLEVFIPQNEIQLGSWQGAGYMLIDPQTGSGAYRISGGRNGMDMSNDISKAVLVVGLLGGAAIFIQWAQVSADDGECGEAEFVQQALMDTVLYLILLQWLLTINQGNNNSGCGCQTPANVIATLLLWFRSTNAALANQAEGCPVFVSAYLSQPGKEMWATSEHIAAAQARGSLERLTWKQPHERNPRDNRNKPECNQDAGSPSSIAYTAEFGMQIAECDEYPFNSTFEGDPSFYKNPLAPLSLKLVPASHNSAQGGTIRAFYSKCHVFDRQLFEVQTDLSPGSKSHGLNANGGQCYP
jgi:hypothetical protein